MFKGAQGPGPKPFYLSRPFFYVASGVLLAAGIYSVLHSGALDWKAVSLALRRFGFWPLFAGFSGLFAQIVLQCLRFQLLCPARFRVHYHAAADAFTTGQLLNVLLPARLGEAGKVVTLVRRGNGELQTSEAVGILASDKLVDFLSMTLLLFSGGFTFLREWQGSLLAPFRSPASLWLVLGVGAVIIISRRWLSHRVNRVFQKFGGVFRESFLSPRRFWIALFTSMACWWVEMAGLYALSLAQGVSISYGGALGAVLCLNLGLALPLTVGNVGAFEAALAFGLTRAGLSFEAAMAVALVHHLFQYLTVAAWWGMLRIQRKLA